MKHCNVTQLRKTTFEPDHFSVWITLPIWPPLLCPKSSPIIKVRLKNIFAMSMTVLISLHLVVCLIFLPSCHLKFNYGICHVEKVDYQLLLAVKGKIALRYTKQNFNFLFDILIFLKIHCNSTILALSEVQPPFPEQIVALDMDTIWERKCLPQQCVSCDHGYWAVPAVHSDREVEGRDHSN